MAKQLVAMLIFVLCWPALKSRCVLGDEGTPPGEPTAAWYVNAEVRQRAGDGKSWKSAFVTVQEGIDAASAAGGGEVWVAQGVYRPTSTSDRSISFRLKPGVALYGGFRAAEKDRTQRDWQKNTTTLSGDIGKFGDDADNSYHVIIGADNAVIDGFTITGGNGIDNVRPDGPPKGGFPGQLRRGPPPSGPPPGTPLPSGGRGGPPSFAPPKAGGPPGPIHTSPEAILSGVQPGAGGGMVNFQSAPIVRNCIFRGNKARKGGAMYNMTARTFPPHSADPPAAAPLVINCTFLDNFAQVRGGAISNDLGTSPEFRLCRFIKNRTEDKGGGIYNDFGCSPLLANCLFVGNSAFCAAAIGNDGGSSPLVVCCTLTKNEAKDTGAALYQGTGPANNPLVVNCILWGNICENGPAEIANWHDCQPKVTGSCVQGGYPGEGNVDQDPRFLSPHTDEYRLAADSPCPSAGYTAEVPKLPARQPFLPRGDRDSATAPSLEPPARLPPQRVVYVHCDQRNAKQDGKTWASAYSSLQAGIDHAWASGGEVWVAKGTYRPTEKPDRLASFRLRPGVTVYGGFLGRETAADQRNPQTNETVLSGDIGKPGVVEDNCYHVLVGADQAVVDGFTISGGNADGQTYDAKGGGMINYRRSPQGPPRGASVGYSPTVRNCKFVGNRAIEGGAMYNYDRGTLRVVNCVFVENVAENGGAIVERVGVTSTIDRCEFLGNRATWRGGALYLDYGARPEITHTLFRGNQSDCHGGALYTISRASQLDRTTANLRDCQFAVNAAKKRGGAISNFDNSMLTVEGCAFSGNQAGTGGGAVANDRRAETRIDHCTFSGNTAAEGNGDIDTDASADLIQRR